LERCDDYLSERKRLIIVSGKRKTAIAKAVVKPGVGKVTVNGYPIEAIHPEIAREKIKEPLLLAGDKVRTMDIKIKVDGGGFMSQAEAVRMALVRGLVNWQETPEEASLKNSVVQVLGEENRNLIDKILILVGF